MRLAWFTPTGVGSAADGFEASGLIGELRADHAIEVFDAARAHDFVWMHARDPFDLCVYDLDDTAAHAYIWAYPCHYPGLLRLPGEWLRTSRSAIRFRNERQSLVPPGLAGSDGDPLAPLVMSARMVVVPDASLADAMHERYPGARIRGARIGAPALDAEPGREGMVRVGTMPGSRAQSVARAVQRAREGGASVVVEEHGSPGDAARRSDIVVALEWPPASGLPRAAVLGLAAARAVVVIESESTASLPCLDPQTWQPRGFGPQPPSVAVSLDPRDEEHSLLLALHRLTADRALREQLGTAGRAWWAGHATIGRTADTWRTVIAEAAAPGPAAVPAGRAAGAPDGSERARAILAEIGATVDILD